MKRKKAHEEVRKKIKRSEKDQASKEKAREKKSKRSKEKIRGEKDNDKCPPFYFLSVLVLYAFIYGGKLPLL